MAKVPFVSNPINQREWSSKMKMRLWQITQDPEYSLRSHFLAAIGAKCPTEIECEDCAGGGVDPSCEYCEEGMYDCEECYGGSVGCGECDQTGEVLEDCGDCDGGQIDCSECDGGIITCTTCEDGKEECPSCGGGEGVDDCSECDGDGTIDCSECKGNIDHKCEYCKGVGEIDCEYCDGDGQNEVTCDECNGDGEIECEYCVGEGSYICQECGGNWDESECVSCAGAGNFQINHPKAGSYFLEPIKSNRSKRMEEFEKAMSILWPELLKEGYEISFIPSYKLTKKYLEHKIHDRVTLYFFNNNDVVRNLIITYMKPNENSGLMGIEWSVFNMAFMNMYGFHINAFMKPKGNRYHEVMIVKTNIKIWEPFTINYLTAPTEKT